MDFIASDQRKEHRFRAGDKVTIRGIDADAIIGQVVDRSVGGIGVTLLGAGDPYTHQGCEVTIENKSGVVRTARIRHVAETGRIGMEWVYRLGDEPTD